MEEFNVLSSELGAKGICNLVEAGGDCGAGISECVLVPVSEQDAANIPEGSI